MYTRVILFLGILAIVAACSAQSSASGSATYDRPADAGGDPVQPQERREDFQVTVTVAGAADFEAVNSALCQLTNGDFTLESQGEGSIDADGRYRTEFSTEAQAGTTVSNPLCGALKNLEIDSVTQLTLEASVPANATNCEGYCQATAEGSCTGGSPSCIANQKASCQTSCEGSTRIKGQGQLSSSQAADVNSRLNGSGRVEAQVDLIFDTLE
jgi:hypothetical protein